MTGLPRPLGERADRRSMIPRNKAAANTTAPAIATIEANCRIKMDKKSAATTSTAAVTSISPVVAKRDITHWPTSSR